MLYVIKKSYVILLKKAEIGSAVAVRLTKYTGRSKTYIHPKHFLEASPWYTKYLKKNDTVLDLGCGNGQSIIKSAKYCKQITGVEIDPGLRKLATASFKSAGIHNAVIYGGNLEQKLKLRSKQFDKVIFLDVLEHLNNRDSILKEIKRVLKPKGMLLVGVPNSETSWKKLQRSVGVNSFSDPDHKIEFSKQDISTLLAKHGFLIKKFGLGKYDTPFRSTYDIIGALYLPAYRKISVWRQQRALLNPQEASGFEIVAQVK